MAKRIRLTEAELAKRTEALLKSKENKPISKGDFDKAVKAVAKKSNKQSAVK